MEVIFGAIGVSVAMIGIVLIGISSELKGIRLEMRARNEKDGIPDPDCEFTTPKVTSPKSAL